MMINRQIKNNLANYIRSLFKSYEEEEFYSSLLNNGKAFIFGGLIRDFFLCGHLSTLRDIDIVVSTISDNFKRIINNYLIKNNQYGGYKLLIGNKNVDIWEINKTWYFKENNSLDFDLVNALPTTAFFNITAVIFSLNDNELIYHDSFEKSLKSKMLDIVNSDNPLPELCIVKTYEYVNKFNLKVGKSLKEYIKKYYLVKHNSLLNIQVKHYGSILFSEYELDNFYNNILQNFEVKQSRKIDKRQLSFFSIPSILTITKNGNCMVVA